MFTEEQQTAFGMNRSETIARLKTLGVLAIVAVSIGLISKPFTTPHKNAPEEQAYYQVGSDPKWDAAVRQQDRLDAQRERQLERGVQAMTQDLQRRGITIR